MLLWWDHLTSGRGATQVPSDWLGAGSQGGRGRSGQTVVWHYSHGALPSLVVTGANSFLSILLDTPQKLAKLRKI